MTALGLQNYLKAHYPKENESCEWKEFKKLKSIKEISVWLKI